MIESLLLIVLEFAGCWIGGQTYSIRLAWSNGAHEPAMIVWALADDDTTIASGKAQLGADAIDVTLTLPEVRAIRRMTWTYRLISHDQLLEEGKRTIFVYPVTTSDGVRSACAGKSVLVCDRTKLLDAIRGIGVQAEPVELAGVTTRRADVIVLGPDLLGDELTDPDLARMGLSCGVIVFAQPRAKRIAGRDVRRRQGGEARWFRNHPLLLEIPESGLPCLLPERGEQVVQRLAAGERIAPALAWQDGESLDSPLLAAATSHGCLVECLLELGPWTRDARARIILVNALAYSAAGPAPSLPLSVAPSGPPAAVPANSHELDIPSDRTPSGRP